MTVIGNGLLAKCFAAAAFSRNWLVLASGVSNSNEQREAEFRRESDAISTAMRAHPSARVIYFSTCSVLQNTQTPYIRHKLAMESLVAAKASSFQIYRLPQVVGLARNLTLVSYFVEAVLQRRKLSVQRQAQRNLVDVDDVSRLIFQLVERDVGVNTTQCLAALHSVHVTDVLQTIGQILDIEPQFDLVDAGESYDIPTAFLRQHFGPDDALMKPGYWQDVLRKHVPAIALKIQSAA